MAFKRRQSTVKANAFKILITINMTKAHKPDNKLKFVFAVAILSIFCQTAIVKLS